MKKAVSFLFLLLFLFLFFPGDASAAPRIFLHELEKELTASPEVLASAASLAGSRALEERQKAAGGLRYFGELSFGGMNEPESRSDASRIEGYSKVSLRAGISVPLFGTWRKERIQELEARIASLEEELRFLTVRKANLTALRKAYTLLWTIQEKRNSFNVSWTSNNRSCPSSERGRKKGFSWRGTGSRWRAGLPSSAGRWHRTHS
jgi:hypothetical protein